MGRDNFKTWKMGMPEDSLAWQDMIEYGRELGMQPAETARVIIVEWSQARRGRMSLGTAMPQFFGPGSLLPQTPTPTETVTSKPKESEAEIERERAKARGARFAGALDLDDD